MALQQKLETKLSQRLVLTPALQQAIKLLPLARMELAQLVRQEIIENPVLEEMLEDDNEQESNDDEIGLIEESNQGKEHDTTSQDQ